MKIAKDSKPFDYGLHLARLLLADVPNIVVHALGPNAVNQAVKAIAVARLQLLKVGRDCGFRPEFSEVTVGDAGHEVERTAMRMHITELHVNPAITEENQPL